MGAYEGEMQCNVVPMQACHVLLGHPWKFDIKAQYDGYTNQYTIHFGGAKVVPKPLPPKIVHEDQMHLYKQFAEEARVRREKKSESPSEKKNEKERANKKGEQKKKECKRREKYSYE